jgi:hypothetical protein
MAPLAAIEAGAFGQAMRQTSWLLPAVATVHLAGVVLLVGSVAMLDLRLLGLSRTLPVRRLAAHVLPWSIASFLLIVPSGLAMFVARAGELIASPVFAAKFGLILLALANAGILHAGVLRDAGRWDAGVLPPRAARAAAAASLLLWLAVIACGRQLVRA